MLGQNQNCLNDIARVYSPFFFAQFTQLIIEVNKTFERGTEMEENLTTEILEAAEKALVTDNGEKMDTGAMLVILGIAAAGGLITIGVMKIGSKIRTKIQERRERKKTKEETEKVIEVETAENTEIEAGA